MGVHRCLGTGAFGSGCSLFAGGWTCVGWVRTVVAARGEWWRWDGGVRTGQGIWRSRPALGRAGEAPGVESCKPWPQCAYFVA